jgi:uncharacterized membrane protein YfcA
VIPFLFGFCIAVGIGIIAAIIGLGGGFLFVPTFTLLFGLDQRTAVGTSLAVTVCAAAAASLRYRQQKKILDRTAVIMLIPSMIVSALGAFVTQYIDARVLVLLFALALVLIALQMFFPALPIVKKMAWGPSYTVNVAELNGDDIQVRVPYLHLLTWGALGGLVTGTTGISGGVVFVPALIATGIPVHFAVATSLFVIVAASFSGAVTHAALGNFSLPFVVVFGAGAAVGAYAGAYIAPGIRADHIRKFFGIMLVVIALLMVQQKAWFF